MKYLYIYHMLMFVAFTSPKIVSELPSSCYALAAEDAEAKGLRTFEAQRTSAVPSITTAVVRKLGVTLGVHPRKPVVTRRTNRNSLL